MKQSNSQLLADLITTLSPAQRELIVEVRDPLELARQIPISGGRAIELAQVSDLIFCKSEAAEYVTAVVNSRSKFLVARPEIMSVLPSAVIAERVLILTPNPRLLMSLLLTPFDIPSTVTNQSVHIHPDAQIAPSAILGPGVVIGADVEVDADCVIGPNTVIDHATIGEGTRIAYNCSIGSDGFGYEIDEETGEIVKFPHLGRVIIGRWVEIFSNVCIARGSLRDTVLEDEVKVDNLVHVAHNCHVRRGAFLIANAMLGGSVDIGEYAWIAPSTSLMNGITVGRCAMTGLGAVAIQTIEDNAVVIGVPAKKLRDRFPENFALLKD
jgi:UDP-3-O-[3-hydroxymyristoyl] glucosamine N-acyltransferase